ncbi:MAG: TolC family protein [Spirochaetales bacterium]|nr:TolC family protein [Spirochaetales bacterium]
MRIRYFIFLLLPCASFGLSFEDFYNKSLEKSPVFMEIREDLLIKENSYLQTKFPGNLNLSGSVSPSYSFDSNNLSKGDLKLGDVGLSFSPFYNITAGVTSNLKDSTNFALSYSPFASKRVIKSAKNSYEIGLIEKSERELEYKKSLKELYMNLYFSRNLYLISNEELLLLNQTILLKEKLYQVGEIDYLSLEDSYIELMEKESSLYSLQLDLLKMEEEIYRFSGIDLAEETVIPVEFSKELDTYKNVNYLEASEYLYIKEKVRDQKMGVTESKMSLLSSISLSGGATTDDFSTFTGYLSLSGSIPLDFNYKRKIEIEKIYLNRANRELSIYEDLISRKEQYIDREQEIKKSRISALIKTVDNFKKREAISRYKMDNGEILENDYKKIQLEYKRVEIDLLKEQFSYFMLYSGE